MKRRPSIYLQDPLIALLTAHGATDEDANRGVSGVLNAVGDRYQEIIRRAMPALSLQEWCCIFDALNGCWKLDQAALIPSLVRMEVADHINLNNADIKWEIDGPALTRKLAALDFTACVAVIDAAERFWASDHREYDEAIPAIVGRGNVIVPE